VAHEWLSAATRSPVAQLLWTFDGQSKRAIASTKEGSYIIIGSSMDAWTAAFRQFRDGTEKIAASDGSGRPFVSLAEALVACQRHCDRSPAGCNPRQASKA
jgi:hypothetical protein